MSVLNKAEVRRLTLDCAKTSGRGKFTRVSSRFIRQLERDVRLMIANRVHTAPSIGKTI